MNLPQSPPLIMYEGEIIDICNGKQVQVIGIDTNEIIYQGETTMAKYMELFAERR